jgi:dTDP-4-dehydrorhamnose reductase
VNILLLGKNGQIGFELQRTLAPLGNITALGRAELDLTNQAAIRSTVRRISPDLIINAAAYTAVDKAEAEPELAMAINGVAPCILAEEAASLKAALVHYSTDYVFDGSKDSPYTEQDTPNPLSIYGQTKLAGEEAVRRSGCYHLILRTAWVYGLRGHNFLLTIRRLAAERDQLSIVDDQYGAPTWCRTIAETTAAILKQQPLQGASGTYHLTAAGSTTWYGFARAIIFGPNVDQAASGPPIGTLQRPTLLPIKTAAYPTAARRPANSRLDCSKLEKAFKLTLPPWQTELTRALQ